MLLVTGANGFVGTHLVPALRNQGHHVREAVRTRGGGGRNDDDRVAIGEIGPDTDWSHALRDVHAIIHLAGLAHVLDADRSALAEPYFRVNTAATAALARAAAAAGVRRLVFASSVKVYGDATSGRVLRESDPAAATDPYGKSKRAAEEALAEIAAATGIEVVSLRLPLVHGPGVKANLLRLFQWIDRGVPLPLAGLTNRRSLLGVANLAHAVGLALTHPRAAGQVFNVSDGEDVSTAALTRRIAAALGRPVRLLPVPAGALRLVARLAGREADFERLAGDLAVDITRIREHLGYVPPQSLDAGLAVIARWYRDAHGAA